MTRIAVTVVAILLLAAAGGAAPQPSSSPRKSAEAAGPLEGLASYASKALHGRRTASGVPFDVEAMVAAHPTLPFGTVVRVTRLNTEKSVEVRIVDRGPAAAVRAKGVIIDLSHAAAAALGFLESGLTRVRLEVVRQP